mmetsp:Transcript_7334/g.8524  ORF Transcript_7334/g.8524 Transcript_7334/m.8524 type:complete len:80 (-) Transcript_7334:3-242(-)
MSYYTTVVDIIVTEHESSTTVDGESLVDDDGTNIDTSAPVLTKNANCVHLQLETAQLVTMSKVNTICVQMRFTYVYETC